MRDFFMVVAFVVALISAIESFAADRSDLPSLELNRHFSTGGSETLALRCKDDRTREEAFVCELKRLRNGMEVSHVTLDYRWTREQMGKFFRQTASHPAPVSDGGHVVLSYDAQNDGKRIQGIVSREDKRENTEHVKALLSLEGSLAGEFYR